MLTSIGTVPPTRRFHWEPVSLSHQVSFARHYYDETKRGNVTKDENVQRECKAIERHNAMSSMKGR